MADLPPIDGSRAVFIDQPFPPPPVFNAEVPKSFVSRSFKDALAGKTAASVICSDLKTSTFHGKPAILFSDEQINLLAAPFAFTLIGKFSLRRPSMETIRGFFSRLKLSGSFVISLLDDRHISIKLENDLDYSRIFARRVYYVTNCQMRLLKWSPLFDIKEESPVVPVWLAFPNLRLHLINHSVLFAIGSLFGRPLQTDQATAALSRPSVARVLVELDVSKKHPSEVWLGSESSGYFQKIVFENIPLFCPHCKLHGHSLDNCFILHPDLRPAPIKPTRGELGLPEIGGEGLVITPLLNEENVGHPNLKSIEVRNENENIDNSRFVGNTTTVSNNERPLNVLNQSVVNASSVSEILEKDVPVINDLGNTTLLVGALPAELAPILIPNIDATMNNLGEVNTISSSNRNVNAIVSNNVDGLASELQKGKSVLMAASPELRPHVVDQNVIRLAAASYGNLAVLHEKNKEMTPHNIPSSSRQNPSFALMFEDGECIPSPASEGDHAKDLDNFVSAYVDDSHLSEPDFTPDDDFTVYYNKKGRKYKKKVFVKVPRSTRSASAQSNPNV